jgi:hypothetical protein
VSDTQGCDFVFPSAKFQSAGIWPPPCPFASADTLQSHCLSVRSGKWLWYVQGAKEVLKAARIMENMSCDSEALAVIGWAYYHDALSSFSLRHWRRHVIGLQKREVDTWLESNLDSAGCATLQASCSEVGCMVRSASHAGDTEIK